MGSAFAEFDGPINLNQNQVLTENQRLALRFGVCGVEAGGVVVGGDAGGS